MTRWWKCDLQVATPGEPRFHGPDSDWDLQSEAGKEAAAERYMARVVEAGLEAIVLADHNSVEWVDRMLRAGRKCGVVVFPGFEVTTATGADGAHAVVFMGPDATAADLAPLLYGACGFDADHPRFNVSAPEEPAPSPKTLPQILDALPDTALAIAPHAFGDNGLVSANTVKGTLRWKALHHDRLCAVDVGDATSLLSANSWRSRFIRRELGDFPRLPSMPFVSTSDAYSLDALGSRFTWIRMAEPTLEGMRQAFLDYEARIVCDWDPRYASKQQTPNEVEHAWVERISIAGLTSASSVLEVEFDPRLTVMVGGRGAGKSTLIGGLRCLYADVDSLPPQVREEVRQLESAVLSSATVTATHRLAHSGEAQMAMWATSAGSSTIHQGGGSTPTDFKVRVISQKELFERAANSPGNPFATSRNLLALVDDALADGASGPGTPGDFAARFDESRTAWVGAARLAQAEAEAIQQRPQVQQRVEELRRQVEAFDNDVSRARRVRNDRLASEAGQYDSHIVRLQELVTRHGEMVDAQLQQDVSLDSADSDTSVRDSLSGLIADLNAIRADLRSELRQSLDRASEAISRLQERKEGSPWWGAVSAALTDSAAFISELAAMGLNPDAYAAVRQRLAEQSMLLEQIDQRATALPGLEAAATEAWQVMESLLADRRARRDHLLGVVAERSGMLRFSLHSATDTSAWVASVRELLSLRVDGFVDDVQTLAKWLWSSGEGGEDRRATWRAACVSGDFSVVAAQCSMRAAWAARLAGLDPLVRTRLGAEMAADTVAMEYRRVEKGDDVWEQLTSGSPGQRSAAMLSFVLHQGAEPLVLDQPEDDLDTEWITELVVRQLRKSRWSRQVIVVTHNANIPVNADAERIIVLENGSEGVRIRRSVDTAGTTHPHCGPIEEPHVRKDIQRIMEGGVDAFIRRERRYNNELSTYRAAMRDSGTGG